MQGDLLSDTGLDRSSTIKNFYSNTGMGFTFLRAIWSKPKNEGSLCTPIHSSADDPGEAAPVAQHPGSPRSRQSLDLTVKLSFSFLNYNKEF